MLCRSYLPKESNFDPQFQCLSDSPTGPEEMARSRHKSRHSMLVLSAPHTSAVLTSINWPVVTVSSTVHLVLCQARCIQTYQDHQDPQDMSDLWQAPLAMYINVMYAAANSLSRVLSHDTTKVGLVDLRKWWNNILVSSNISFFLLLLLVRNLFKDNDYHRVASSLLFFIQWPVNTVWIHNRKKPTISFFGQKIIF